jgi:predicted unusual protein kinase regulating ubiquinone biosynthesis (AarF/ABC1/UbiB family)
LGELGPTFIKLGQLLSTRKDLFPEEVIAELSLLQDSVGSFPGATAIKIIEEEFQKPIYRVFDSFNSTPIASASLGQVHLASKKGKTVAVKVQRPNLKRIFDRDLRIMRALMKIFKSWSGLTQVLEQSIRLLYEEIDYKSEAMNSIRFKKNFHDISWVKVPDVDLDLTTSKIITMEYIPTIKITDMKRLDAAGIDRRLLVRRLAESFLIQLFSHKFFRKFHFYYFQYCC